AGARASTEGRAAGTPATVESVTRGPHASSGLQNTDATSGLQNTDATSGLHASLSLEDRLVVAFARRGEQRIGQFVENALLYPLRHGRQGCLDCIYDTPDDALLRAIEAHADRLGQGDA